MPQLSLNSAGPCPTSYGGVALLLLFGMSHIGLADVWGLTLTAPVAGVTVQSGSSIPIAIEVGKDESLSAVKYYWYRGDEEPLPSHQATPARFVAAEGSSGFSGKIVVPPDAFGRLRLLAIGQVTRGRLAGHEDFDEVVLTALPKAMLTAIEFSADKPWRLDPTGKRVLVPAVGQFDDGIVRAFTGLDTGTLYRSSDPNVVLVQGDGMLQVRGRGKAFVTVEHQGKTGSVEVVVEAEAESNREPIARVVPDIAAKAGSLVVLDGLQSQDPDGDLLRYEWRQLRGQHVSLTTVNEAKSSFVAPPVSARKRFQFALVVTDMAGPDQVKGADSLPAIVTVWVNP